LRISTDEAALELKVTDSDRNDTVSTVPLAAVQVSQAAGNIVENLHLDDKKLSQPVNICSVIQMTSPALPVADEIFIRSFADLEKGVSPLSLMESYPTRPNMLFNAISPEELKV
jgi:hypothetical protein